MYFSQARTTGDAMKIDEYVPIEIPKRSTIAKFLIVSPPKTRIARTEKSVVADVKIVLDNV